MKKSAAFTLFEMIVVVIMIGILALAASAGPAALVGANVTSSIGLIKKYESGAQLFYDSFACLPGDCSNASSVLITSNVNINGDGDNVIGIGSPPSSFENYNVFTHLYLFGLKLDNLTLGPCAAGGFTYVASQSAMQCISIIYNGQANYPTFSPINNAYITMHTADVYTGVSTYSRNLIITIATMAGSAYSMPAGTMSTPQIQSLISKIDSKIDDGIPNTGDVMLPSQFAVQSTGIYQGPTYNGQRNVVVMYPTSSFVATSYSTATAGYLLKIVRIGPR